MSKKWLFTLSKFPISLKSLNKNFSAKISDQLPNENHVPTTIKIIGILTTVPFVLVSLIQGSLVNAKKAHEPPPFDANANTDDMPENNALHQQRLDILWKTEQAANKFQSTYGLCIVSLMSGIHFGLEAARFGGVSAPIPRILFTLFPMSLGWLCAQGNDHADANQAIESVGGVADNGRGIYNSHEKSLIGQAIALNLLLFVDGYTGKNSLSPKWLFKFKSVYTGVVGISLFWTYFLKYSQPSALSINLSK